MLEKVMLDKLKKVMCSVGGFSLEDYPAESVLLAASPIIKTPMTNPYRIVLRLVDIQFVIHQEIWQDCYTQPDGTLVVGMKHGDYYDGHYYALNEFSQAYFKWCKMCMHDAEQHAVAIYREMDK